MTKTSLPPGFRFHPTDVELVWYYLKRKIMGKPFRFEAISEVQLYKFAPWDLRDKSCLSSRDLEWYFFCPRDKKYSQGSRTNRATDTGFWKATGKDRTIVHNSQTVGMKKTLIFHLGKAPHGSRTDWVMYEFRLESQELLNAGYAQDAYVLCKIFQKSGPGPKNGEQYGAPFNDDDWDVNIEHPAFFPISPAENAHLFPPVPLQSVASVACGPSSMLSSFEVGEPSSMLSNFEVGEPSSMVSNFEVGEPSYVPEPYSVEGSLSMQYLAEVGESSFLPEPSYDDGIFVEQLEAVLSRSPTHSENAYREMLDSAYLHEYGIPASGFDFEYLNGDLVDFSDRPFPEPTYGNPLADVINCEYELHPALAELADEHYMELSDIGFAGNQNPVEFVAPADYNCPFANDPCSFLDDTYFDSVVDTYMSSEPQISGLSFSEDPVPSSEAQHLPKEGSS
ncbi:uncharacterized protein A4U43_UnF6130 [Asparagus officinalis]|uniref:NAC domain-containing protein n=1 Tax=Asparagus officinalis TaxID=4686 RepID=A0A1R3L6J3_ASPOF|nr:protein ATAF2-like isoform X2 [Asparagus officinalis]ONK55228.1 uncharacterized protein A4U43_UnF6130 [Asparagus officinalis]